MIDQCIKKILNAQIYDLVEETPVTMARLTGEALQNEVFLKREDLQPVFSFKLRGAYNKLLSLSEEQKSCGVIAASAGNHAQGVALAAKKLGIKATIVMPCTTPGIKVDSVRRNGAEVVLFGDAFDAACAHAHDLQKKSGAVFVHPYDDEDVIAGQGTIGLELLRQISGDIDMIFVPVGGGGLAAGVAAIVKYLRPEIKIIAVEAQDSACLKAAMNAGERVRLPEVGIFADGVAVAQIGEVTFEYCKQYIDECITVDTDEICAAIKDFYEDTRSITEPAGALSLAGLKKYVKQHQLKNKKLVAVSSGANVNFDRLRNIAERAEIGEKREAILAVTVPEKQGTFGLFAEALQNVNITEFNYRYSPADLAHLFVGLELEKGAKSRCNVISSLENQGFKVVDLTDSEVAKIHLRHMVGGRAHGLENEKIFLFEFPERPGALTNFLEGMASRWNVSLFHYRNHGSAFGRVYMGVQVPDAEMPEIEKAFDDLGFRYWEDTNNPAYELFLK